MNIDYRVRNSIYCTPASQALSAAQLLNGPSYARLTSNAPTVGDTASEAQGDKPVAVQADIPNDGDDDDNYDGRGKRTPQLF
jgi:hypothetical protein